MVGDPRSKQNLATDVAGPMVSKDCSLISTRTEGGLPFKTYEEGEITW
jgi:hypothetical protein